MIVGVTFVVVVLMAMIIGLSAAVYYSWIAPWCARTKLQRQLRKAAKRRPADELSETPDLEKNLVRETDNRRAYYEPSESMASLHHQEHGDVEEELRPPALVYLFHKKFRFSTSTQDGVWWFV